MSKRHNDKTAIQRFNRIRTEIQLIRATYKANLGMTLMVLHDKFGMSPDQLEEFIDHCAVLLDHYNDGRLTFEDIQQLIKDETGIEIK